MINFDNVPSKNPAGPVDAGRYLATVVSATVKTPKQKPDQPKKKEFLEVVLKLVGADGQTRTFTDRLFDSDSPYVMFKVGQFIKGCELTLTGEVSFHDIAKLVVNKQLVAIITQTVKKNEVTGIEDIESDINCFKSECYLPASAWEGPTADAPTADTGADTADEPVQPTETPAITY